MSGPGSRRGFLRSLVSLPLIGGGVTLIGAPSAVAIPPSDEVLEAYIGFLAHEHRAALAESHLRSLDRMVVHRAAIGEPLDPQYVEMDRARAYAIAPMAWIPDDPSAERIVTGAASSSRAALVLSAVGLDCRRFAR